ncbi:hypothetical protein MKW98_004901 [Papaver atlanticum]|uniref:N-acetyltransferase domain-containing protein n=1 Tax=Papaver atlanticum TaxID=357466 RepID=A0AAD4SHU0_9MAGN|nr:hypothetical protein MKW98_004901 [Papaver atlanticum]
MVVIRQATMDDIPGMQDLDLHCFEEENHPGDYLYYEDYLVLWPRLSFVAEENGTGRIIGYVVAKMELTKPHGYISYLGVGPTNRRKGIAKKLMSVAQNAMVQEYGPERVSLHVLKSSRAAINLFTKRLGYKFYESADMFYDNGEDAYVLVKLLQGKQPADHIGDGFGHAAGCFSSEAAKANLKGQMETLQLS